jgi:hypothetical protein
MDEEEPSIINFGANRKFRGPGRPSPLPAVQEVYLPARHPVRTLRPALPRRSVAILFLHAQLNVADLLRNTPLADRGNHDLGADRDCLRIYLAQR